MRFENTRVYNFKHALRGMRNPKESWNKSDSYFGLINCEYDNDALAEIAQNWTENEIELRVKQGQEEDIVREEYDDLIEKYQEWLTYNGILEMEDDMAEVAYIGPNDLDLAQRLIRGGSEHRKFMRQIFVTVDITAPLYW